MDPAPSPSGSSEPARSPWRPFQAELARTAGLALWGLWALCVILVVPMLFGLAVNLAGWVF